jgi:hypothetical protein
MKTKFLLFLFILFYQFSFSQTNVNVSSNPFPDTEPYIAVNPANPNNLIAAWMHLNINLKVSINTKVSTDGGLTWGNLHSMPHYSSSFTSADVSIAFNATGTAFISFIDSDISIDSGFVRCSKSTDGGITWSNPVNVISAGDSPDLPVDRPWIACDKSSGPYSGRLYIVSKSYYAATPPQKVWMSFSSDSGLTWTPIQQLDAAIPCDLLTNIMGTPTVGADGSFYVSYMSWHVAASPYPRVICTKSTDGGTTFTQHIILTITGSSGMNDSLYQGSYSLAANPAASGNLIFQATDNRNGDPDIYTVYSTDGGINWSAPALRVNDDAIGNGIGQDMSWGAFSPNGTYAVAWRDRRNSGNTTDTAATEIFTAISTNGGISFSQNYNLSSAPSPFINIQKGNDFIGVCMNNTNIFTDWCDLRTNNDEIFSNSELQLQILPVSEIPGQAAGAEIFPNPCSGSTTLTIHDEKSSEWNFKVFDVSGKLVFEKTIHSRQENIQMNLVKGIYFYKVKNEKQEIASGKLLVN